MYKVLDKYMIEIEIVPYIPKTSRGFPPTVPLHEVVKAILFKLIGVQWSNLPVTSLFGNVALSWQSVYHHYRKWCKGVVWKDCWIRMLYMHRASFDLSSVDLDGSHTPALRGGEGADYQGRKKGKTTNSLYMTDRQGLPIAMSEPVAGNHNDMYDIGVQFEVVTATLEEADLSTEGLFLNADAGFGSRVFRESCSAKGINANGCFNERNGSTERDEYFDKVLYNKRYAVERTNAWMDSYRSLPDRFDNTNACWKGFNYLAFMVIALKKFENKNKKKV